MPRLLRVFLIAVSIFDCESVRMEGAFMNLDPVVEIVRLEESAQALSAPCA
jgi:hypothetical protein